ncbi:hypothetical protein LIX60_07850 [Streptomyces sp. S07_1.15]|uniref:hypothetical protein n=1 Tax=Streptomyces sp. S07_1.15 TaxID=2873925 RepID=UPI001D140456|nr:hypothetical protein [Streptomyces sp. S07_1.15]MCC3651383.1 hypothetical protein [Streptomyces sp. S07_1.15]
MATDLELGVDALKKFRSRIDGLLTELESGNGGSSKVALERVTRASFSGTNLPFAEADGFYLQYNRVHKALVELSKSLGDQIEMLSIAVHAADVGFDNVEQDLRRRFHDIRVRLEAAARAEAERDEQHGGEKKPLDGDKNLPSDMG